MIIHICSLLQTFILFAFHIIFAKFSKVTPDCVCIKPCRQSCDTNCRPKKRLVLFLAKIWTVATDHVPLHISSLVSIYAGTCGTYRHQQYKLGAFIYSRQCIVKKRIDCINHSIYLEMNLKNLIAHFLKAEGFHLKKKFVVGCVSLWTKVFKRSMRTIQFYG